VPVQYSQPGGEMGQFMIQLGHLDLTEIDYGQIRRYG
jgi:hypothetical protein